MRRALGKLKHGKYYIFQAIVGQNAYQHKVLYDIILYEDDGKTVRKYITDHCLVAKKPFKGMTIGTPVRFTGKLRSYTRGDGSLEYGIIVNRAKIIKGGNSEKRKEDRQEETTRFMGNALMDL